MTFETLQYTDAGGLQQEVAIVNLVSRGTVKMQFTPRSHAPSEFHITLPQPPETPVVIPFKSQCVVWACRQSATGAANSFSGGQKIFQGRCWELPGSSSARNVSTEIILFDALRDLQNITFLGVSGVIGSGSPSLTYTYWPDAVLFLYNPAGQRRADGTFAPYNPAVYLNLITTWQTITDVVNYAASFLAGTPDAVQLQLAPAAEFTPQYRSTYPVRAMNCLQAVTTCLQTHPGVYTELDYNTTPPTLHFRDRTKMVPVTLPYKSTDDAGRAHVASDIQPLFHLQPARIAIYYKINATVNGQPAPAFGYDIYPPAGGPFLLTKSYSCDLTGSSVQVTSKNFVSAAFVPGSLDLWRLKVPSLRQVWQGGMIPNDGTTGALQLVPGTVSVVDETGAPVDYTNTYVYYTDQPVYAWFGAGITAIKATVKAHFSYTKNGAPGRPATVVGDHEHSFRATLTNAPTGLYWLKQTINPGEAIPANLAQSIWAELQPLQYKLRHEIIQVAPDTATVPTIIKPGLHAVNLSGGAAAWTAMNAVPENVTVTFQRTSSGLLVARHAITCGPVNFLEPAQLLELLNAFVKRNLRKIDTNSVLGGNASSSQLDLTATEGRENSVPSVPDITTDAATATVTLP